MNVTIIQQPLVEPVRLDEAKMYLRIDLEYENTLLEQLIQTARRLVEDYTNRALITQVCRVLANHRDFLAKSLVLPAAPFQGIINHPKLLRDNRESTLSRYKVDRSRLAAQFVLEEELVEDQIIQIEYRCGYGDTPQDIPQPLKQAILLSTCYLYENRGEEGCILPTTIRTLLDPYRVLNVM